MADKKISALTAAATPLAGTEVLPIVQSGATVKVSVDNLTSGKNVPAASITVSANSAGNAVLITQTGAGNALVVEDSTNPDASPVIINNDGRLLIGDTTSRTIAGITTSAIQIGSTNSDGFRAGLSAFAWDADATGSVLAAGTIVLNRSASDTTGTATAVVANNCLGSYRWTGADGTGFRPAAGVYAFVDGAVAANSVPGRIVFHTTVVGGTTDAERMRIANNGAVGINEPAPDYRLDVNGTFGFTPGNSVTPVDNGDVVFELTNNTTLTVKAKGSDGVVRSGTIILV